MIESGIVVRCPATRATSTGISLYIVGPSEKSDNGRREVSCQKEECARRSSNEKPLT